MIHNGCNVPPLILAKLQLRKRRQPAKMKKSNSSAAELNAARPPTEPNEKNQAPQKKATILQEGFKPSGPFTPGPLTVFDSHGKKYTINEKRLIDCIPHISREVEEVVTTAQVLNKADVWELVKLYKRNRKINPNNVAILRDRMNSGTYVEDYPNLKWDTLGDQVDGKHTGLAFMNSSLEQLRFTLALGIDSRMGPRHDTGLPRDVVAQGLYLPFNPYRGITDYNDRKSFMAAAGYITLLLGRYGVWPELAQIRSAKRQLCQHSFGQYIVRQTTSHFSAVRRIIHECELDTEGMNKRTGTTDEACENGKEDAQSKSWTKAAIITAGTIASLMGRRELFEQLASGANLPPKSALLELSQLIWSLAGEQSAAQREQEQVVHTIVNILGHMKAHEEHTPTPKLLPRIKIDRYGTTQRIYGDFPKEKQKADKALRQEIVRYWLADFEQPGAEELQSLAA